ncbi:MAG TPA: sulfite exporter TauE/SafE family protein [Polyangiaceae bacterium]
MDRITLEVCFVVFVATAVRSAIGFGEALVGVPLLALLIPIKVAAPVAALVSITVAAVVMVQDWRHVEVRSALRLVLATLPGIPLGLWLLTHAPEALVKALLATIIIVFSVWAIVRPATGLVRERWAWLFGFVSGVLGGAYGMNGPPLAIYGALRKWSPAEFRATLQGYFLPASIVGMGGYFLAGLWSSRVTRLYAVSLPFVAVAIVLGSVVNRHLDAHRFISIVYGALVVIGGTLLVQSIAMR